MLKILAMQAGKTPEKIGKVKALEPESDATNLLKCHRAPKPREPKTQNPDNKKRLNRQEPPKTGSGSNGPASSYP